MFVDKSSISHIDTSNKIMRSIAPTKGSLKGRGEYFMKNPSTFPEVSYLNTKTIHEKNRLRCDIFKVFQDWEVFQCLKVFPTWLRFSAVDFQDK